MNVAYAKTAEQVIGVISSGILQPIIYVLFALAFVIFLYGVVEFIANASNEERRTEGKRHMIWGALGLFLMFAVGGILRILINFVSSIR